MNKKYTAITVAVLVLLLGAGWALGFFSGVDPEVAELERLRDETMSDDERRYFRDRIRELPDPQRRQFFERNRPAILQMINQRMDEFLAMSPEEQRAELDKRIDRMEERRREREANGDRDSNRGDTSPEQRDQRRKEMLDRTSPDMRAKVDQIMDKMNNRRRERGLDPINSPRGMFGRPGGGGRGR